MGKFSQRLNKRVQNKGPKIGWCVICGSHGELTRDHVPPKQCNNLNDYEINILMPNKEYSKKGTTSQGGTHYRTLCKKCNSERLGINYDPELIKLTREITDQVRISHSGNLILPDQIHLFVKPQKVARSIIGHTLAAIAVEEARIGLVSSPFADAMRGYFLDHDAYLPEELDIFFWVYPSKRQVVMKHMGKKSIRYRETVVGHIIKFLPLGFWVVWNKPKSIDLGLPSLPKDKHIRIDGLEQVSINLKEIPPLSFPEAPADDEFVVFNSEYAVKGVEKSNKGLNLTPGGAN